MYPGAAHADGRRDHKRNSEKVEKSLREAGGAAPGGPTARAAENLQGVGEARDVLTSWREMSGEARLERGARRRPRHLGQRLEQVFLGEEEVAQFVDEQGVEGEDGRHGERVGSV